MTLIWIFVAFLIGLFIAGLFPLINKSKLMTLKKHLSSIPRSEVDRYTIEYHSDIKRWKAKYDGNYIRYRVSTGYGHFVYYSDIETKKLAGIKQKIYEHYLKTHQPAKTFNIKGKEITLN